MGTLSLIVIWVLAALAGLGAIVTANPIRDRVSLIDRVLTRNAKMTVRVTTKTGAWYECDDYYEDVIKMLEQTTPDSFIELTRVDGGFPKPKITIKVSEIESVRQVNR